MNSITEIKSFFTQAELDYLLPLFKQWCRNESEVINWFQTYQIPACANKTLSDFCNLGEKDCFLQFVKHIEYSGFS